MIKIKRKKQPDIDIYTLKDQTLTQSFRNDVLAFIDASSEHFSSFIPRLQDQNEKFTKAEKETLEAIRYYADPAHFANGKKALFTLKWLIIVTYPRLKPRKTSLINSSLKRVVWNYRIRLSQMTSNLYYMSNNLCKIL